MGSDTPGQDGGWDLRQQAVSVAQALIADGMARWAAEHAALEQRPLALPLRGVVDPASAMQLAQLRANIVFDVPSPMPWQPTAAGSLADAIIAAAQWGGHELYDTPLADVRQRQHPDDTLLLRRVVAAHHPAEPHTSAQATVGSRLAAISIARPAPTHRWHSVRTQTVTSLTAQGVGPWQCPHCRSYGPFLIAHPDDADPAAGAWLLCRCTHVARLTPDIELLAAHGIASDQGIAALCRDSGFGPLHHSAYPTDARGADIFPERQLRDISVGGDIAWRAAARAAADAVAAMAHSTHALCGDVDAYILATLILHSLAERTGRSERGAQELRDALSSGAHTVYTLLQQAMPDRDELRYLKANEGWQYRARHWPLVTEEVRRGQHDLDGYDPHILALTGLTGMPHRRPVHHQGAGSRRFSQAFGTLSEWFHITAEP